MMIVPHAISYTNVLKCKNMYKFLQMQNYDDKGG